MNKTLKNFDVGQGLSQDFREQITPVKPPDEIIASHQKSSFLYLLITKCKVLYILFI